MKIKIADLRIGMVTPYGEVFRNTGFNFSPRFQETTCWILFWQKNGELVYRKYMDPNEEIDVPEELQPRPFRISASFTLNAASENEAHDKAVNHLADLDINIEIETIKEIK